MKNKQILLHKLTSTYKLYETDAPAADSRQRISMKHFPVHVLKLFLKATACDVRTIV